MKRAENSRVLARLWRALVNPERRMASEGRFLLDILGTIRHSAVQGGGKLVFDSCMGMGATSVYLTKSGFNVTSNEICNSMRAEALKYAEEQNATLNIVSQDWRKLTSGIACESFDAVLCQGNSLTYLIKRKEQLAALQNFHAIIKKGGLLILDTRNYERMLDEKDSIIGNAEAFSKFNKFVYCGTDEVPITPILIEAKKVVLKYTHLQRGEEGYLQLYPFALRELRDLAYLAGFVPVQIYSDYEMGIDGDACFFQLVCMKL